MPSEDVTPGDAFAGALATAISQRQDDLPEDDIQAFQNALEELIIDHLTEWLDFNPEYTMHLSTDYSPTNELAEACNAAGIEPGLTTFPWKTSMWVEPGSVRVSSPSGHPSDSDAITTLYGGEHGDS